MRFTLDDTPPPVTMVDRIEALEPGQALTAIGDRIGSVRQTVTRIRQRHPDRDYRTRRLEGGVRVWRTA